MRGSTSGTTLKNSHLCCGVGSVLNIGKLSVVDMVEFEEFSNAGEIISSFKKSKYEKDKFS